MFPKSVSASSAVDHENKGDGMATKRDKQAADYQAEAIAAVTECRSGQTKGDGMSQGMRTERVVLEVTRKIGGRPMERLDWNTILYGIAIGPGPGESVRVVEEDERQEPPTTKPATTENDYVPPAPESRPAETRQTQAERIRGGWWFPKYDKPSAPPPPPPAPPRVHRGSGVFDANGDEVPWDGVVAMLTAERDAAIRERDTLKARLKDSQNCSGKFWSQILVVASERDKLKARVAELEAASGGGAGEPVAWMCEWTDHVGLHHTKTDAEDEANGDVVPQPLYRAPPQPRGWLTGEEKAAIRWAMSEGFDEEVLRALLARSTPPEVVLPGLFALSLLGDRLLIESQVKEALTAAGVAVKEVG